jgi:hypothetical protein
MFDNFVTSRKNILYDIHKSFSTAIKSDVLKIIENPVKVFLKFLKIFNPPLGVKNSVPNTSSLCNTLLISCKIDHDILFEVKKIQNKTEFQRLAIQFEQNPNIAYDIWKGQDREYLMEHSEMTVPNNLTFDEFLKFLKTNFTEFENLNCYKKNFFDMIENFDEEKIVALWEDIFSPRYYLPRILTTFQFAPRYLNVIGQKFTNTTNIENFFQILDELLKEAEIDDLFIFKRSNLNQILLMPIAKSNKHLNVFTTILNSTISLLREPRRIALLLKATDQNKKTILHHSIENEILGISKNTLEIYKNHLTNEDIIELFLKVDFENFNMKKCEMMVETLREVFESQKDKSNPIIREFFYDVTKITNKDMNCRNYLRKQLLDLNVVTKGNVFSQL